MTSKERPSIETPREPAVEARGKVRHWVVTALLAIVVLLAAGWFRIAGRRQASVALAAETQRLSIPTVAVARPHLEQRTDELELPGNVQAYTESSIYSRTNGYLARWYKDIGSFVNQGDLLADIDTPEVDQELVQARAARQQTMAALELARTSADRWQHLRETDSVSQQELDQKLSDHSQAQANLAAADANVRRLEELESFKRIYAPFAGVITRRNIDIGALVNAGNGGSGRELFALARIDPLRVYVSVPEVDAPAMRPGVPAFLEVAALPGSRFGGTVVRTANAIDANTRTLLTEINVPNPAGRLLPGSFAEVHFRIPQASRRLSVPSNAMLFRAEGPRLAVVGPDNKIQLRSIAIGRDLGTSLEILGGVGPGDRIVLNPPDSLEQGQVVRVGAAS